MAKTPETPSAGAASGHVDEKPTPLEQALIDKSEVLVQVDDGAHLSFSVLLLSWAQSRRGERVKFYVPKDSSEWRALCASREIAASVVVEGRSATMLGFEAEQLSVCVELLVERQSRREQRGAIDLTTAELAEWEATDDGDLPLSVKSRLALNAGLESGRRGEIAPLHHRYVITPVDETPVKFSGGYVEGTIELPIEPDTSHEKGNSTR